MNAENHEKVEFREITKDTLFEIIRLSNTLSEQHSRMVAPNSVSIAEAHFSENAWFRGIYAGDRAVGFIMVDTSEVIEDESDPEKDRPMNGWFLWRFMMAASEQGRGYGRQALDILVDMMREKGYTELRTSCGKGPGSPLGFYEKYGFKKTGRELSGEIELILKI